MWHIFQICALPLTLFRFCYEDDCTKEDPLSQESFRKLALPLPYSKQHHSKLVCYITKELMDTENPPLVLPNGYVYSTKVGYSLWSIFFFSFLGGIRWYIISVSIAGPWGNGKEKQWYYYMPKNKFCLQLHRSDQGIYILSLHWDHWSGLYSRSFNPYMAVAWYIIAGPCPRTQLHMSNVHILV